MPAVLVALLADIIQRIPYFSNMSRSEYCLRSTRTTYHRRWVQKIFSTGADGGI